MVVFACNACGASVKKNQVEKHYQQQCRRCESVSCMDCGKDFFGEEFKQHNKCVTESEKYAPTGWQPKANANKGERKQEEWISAINQAVSEATDMQPELRDLLTTLTQYSNIPRKRVKFENFIANSVHVRNRTLTGKAWQVFEKAIQKPTAQDTGPKQKNGSEERLQPQPDKNEQVKEDGDSTVTKKLNKRERKLARSGRPQPATEAEDDDDIRVKKKGKRKRDENEEPVECGAESVQSKKKSKKGKQLQQSVEETKNNNESNKNGSCEPLNPDLNMSEIMQESDGKRFDWTGVVLALLGGTPDHEMSMKKLQRKVLAEYENRGCATGGAVKTKEQVLAKLEKRLKRTSQVKVIGNTVKLVTEQS